MRALAVAAIGLLALYGALPFLSLYHLQRDLRSHDLLALEDDIDWPAVRAGLKQDVAGGMTGASGPAIQVTADNGDDLPPFGSGFVHNLVENTVDQTVTPEHLADSAAALRAAGAHGIRLTQVYLASPTSLFVSFSAANAATRAAVVRLRIELVRDGLGLRWKVTRAWLPPDMLAAMAPHAS